MINYLIQFDKNLLDEIFNYFLKKEIFEILSLNKEINSKLLKYIRSKYIYNFDNWNGMYNRTIIPQSFNINRNENFIPQGTEILYFKTWSSGTIKFPKSVKYIYNYNGSTKNLPKNLIELTFLCREDEIWEMNDEIISIPKQVKILKIKSISHDCNHKHIFDQYTCNIPKSKILKSKIILPQSLNYYKIQTNYTDLKHKHLQNLPRTLTKLVVDIDWLNTLKNLPENLKVCRIDGQNVNIQKLMNK